MSATSYPKLSVAMTVFTAFDDQHHSRPSNAQLEQGPAATDSFGMGLWAVTRKANEGESYQSAPRGLRVIPASLVRSDESLKDTAHRIVKQELGIDVTFRLRQTRIFDDVPPDSEGRVITINFWTFVHIDAMAPLLGGKDQVGLELVSSSAFLDNWNVMTRLEKFDGVSRFGLRFAQTEPQAHRKQLTTDLWGNRLLDDLSDDMIFYSWRDLRYGFTGRFDPFRFMGSHALGKTFRLSELRELYEVVRGEKIQADFFRRLATGAKGYVEEAGSIDTSGSRPGKPASLYKLKDWAEPATGYKGTQ